MMSCIETTSFRSVSPVRSHLYSSLALFQGTDRFNKVQHRNLIHSVSHEPLRVLLLEDISPKVACAFSELGFTVDQYSTLPEKKLISILPSYHAICIRNKTNITAHVIKAATKLLVIGCFCTEADKVDVHAAAQNGIPVFKSSFSDSRSVAELVLSEIIALSRQLAERSYELRNGIWNKQSKGCWEVRGKTLGIIGYGRIGSQVSVLAESLGMRILFYDVRGVMPLGSAQRTASLAALLAEADFVSIHVPAQPETMGLVSHIEMAQMKEGSYLINTSYTCAVDIPAVIDALRSGHLAGAALDVFPVEPCTSVASFDGELNPWARDLCELPNVILTPHIGGSTEDALWRIDEQVTRACCGYLSRGSTMGALNFPDVDLPLSERPDRIRVYHVQRNHPGALKHVHDALASFNVVKQASGTRGDIMYLVAEVGDVTSSEGKRLRELMSSIEDSILTKLQVCQVVPPSICSTCT